MAMRMLQPASRLPAGLDITQGNPEKVVWENLAQFSLVSVCPAMCHCHKAVNKDITGLRRPEIVKWNLPINVGICESHAVADKSEH